MRPLLEDRVDPLPRSLLYVPVALVLGLLLFFVVGLTNLLGFGPSLVLGLALGFGAALAVTGSPLAGLPDEVLARKPWFYFPLALLVFLLSYALLGLAYSEAGLPVAYSAWAPLAGALVLGLVVPYLLVGFPDLLRFRDRAVDRVPDAWWDLTPWLFFPLALVLGFLAYVIVGLAYTESPLPSLYLTQVSVGLATVAGLALAYLLVGFPETPTWMRHPLRTVPEERRPWLVVPLGLAFALVLFFLLGVAYTAAPIPPGLGLPVSLVLAAVLGFGAAYALVGAPTPDQPVRAYAPELPPAARPVAFVVTFLLVGPVLAFAAGMLLGQLPLLPQPFFLPLALAVGYLAAFGVAVLAWGMPGSWKGVPAPGLPEDARLALVLPLALVLGALFTFAVELLTPLDLVGSLLVGGSAGVLAALYGTGATDRLQESDRETLLPELPETVKPVVFLPTWIGSGTLLAFLLGAAGLPFVWSVIAGASAGFALALAVVEEPLLRAALGRRRERKAHERELERRREEMLEGET